MVQSQHRTKHRNIISCVIFPLLVIIVLETTHLNHQFQNVSIISYPHLQLQSHEDNNFLSQKLQNYDLNLFTTYTISDTVVRKYDKWHITVQNLSQIHLLPPKWTPYIHDWSNHPAERSHRFPTVLERIKYYMGKWYNVSVPLYGTHFDKCTYIQRQTTIKYETYSTILVNLFDLDPEKLYNKCYKNKKELHVMSPYCRDYIDIAILHSEGSANVLQFMGDALPTLVPDEIIQYPIFAKVRPLCCGITNQTHCNSITAHINAICHRKRRIEPIILPLNRKRHFGIASLVPSNDISWDNKMPKAVWRGKCGKIDKKNVDNGILTKTDDIKYGLVSRYLNSSFIDAKFSSCQDSAAPFMIGSFMTMKAQLKYRYIISIEGNDVSSGLKWMLFSNSVVLAPAYTWESWAMEGMLKPFVHYLPIKRDMSNVEEIIQWAEEHPKQTRLISERSTLFIYDMLFHPDSILDEKLILQGMMEIYEKNFGQKNTKQNVKMHWTLDVGPTTDRSSRFPSVDERVRYYMGKWYSDIENVISMKRSNIDQLSTLFPNTGISRNTPFIASGEDLSRCALTSSKFTEEVRKFCQEALPTFDERITADLKSNSFDRLCKLKNGRNISFSSKSSWIDGDSGFKSSKRVLLDDSIKVLNFGLLPWNGNQNVPVFSKARLKLPNNDGDVILWPFGIENEVDIVKAGWIESIDMPFNDKISKAISIHTLGGPAQNISRRSFKSKSLSIADLNASFVENHTLTKIQHLQMILSYRYLVVSEVDYRINNDLICVLWSKSVVLMPVKLQFESWVMESKLEPFVHYVPIKADMSNIVDMVKWAEKNPQKTQFISEQSTLYVYDLFFHSDSHHDNLLIMEKIMAIYEQNFA